MDMPVTTTIIPSFDRTHWIWPAADDIFGYKLLTMSTAALLMPYNPKMMPRQEIDALVRSSLGQAQKQLQDQKVFNKLKQVVETLNSSTNREGVAIFVSEAVEKVIYLSFPIEHQVIVNKPILVRDIADHNPLNRDYLILLLSSKESKMYLSNGNGMHLVKSNVPQTMYAYRNEVPTPTGNFSDVDERREVMLNKFLHHMDLGLGSVLRIYPHPVLVVATERVAGHFEHLTQHGHRIAGYVYKDGINAGADELKVMLAPFLSNWKETRSELIVRQMEKAVSDGKLACGIHEASKAVRCHNSRMIICAEESLEKTDFCSRDEIDELVEGVIQNGGEVVKIAKELLEPFGPVAVIRYY